MNAAPRPSSGSRPRIEGEREAEILDALDIDQAIVAGYDWGDRAACVVAALWPERVRGLVTVGGYNIQHLASAGRPGGAEQELAYWYQWYFHTERGRAGLEADRRGLCRLLWRLWSPTWPFGDATFEQSAAAFGNPDFVDVVIHSYRHRLATAPGDEETLFVYYTTGSDNRVGRVSLAGGKVGRPKTVLTDIPTSTHHHGGRLLFDDDGMLLVSTGDAEQSSLAQDRRSLAGKILRIRPDGRAAPGPDRPECAPHVPQGLAPPGQDRLDHVRPGVGREVQVG